MHEKLAEIFTEVEEQPPIEIVRQGRVVRSLRVLQCRDLQEPAPAFTRLQPVPVPVPVSVPDGS